MAVQNRVYEETGGTLFMGFGLNIDVKDNTAYTCLLYTSSRRAPVFCSFSLKIKLVALAGGSQQIYKIGGNHIDIGGDFHNVAILSIDHAGHKIQ